MWSGGLVLIFAGLASADGYRDFNSGAVALARSDDSAAIEFLSHALSEGDLPEHLRATAYLARGYEYLSERQYDSAISDFETTIRLKPDWADPYVALCDAYSSKRMYNQALALCAKAIQIQPDNWLFHLDRARVYFQMHRWDDAAAEYSSFVAERPKDANLHLGRADVYSRMGQFDKALADIDAANQLLPRYALPYVTRGLVYFEQGDYSKSVDSYESAIDLEPKNAADYLARGQVQWAMGRFDKASDSFEDSLEYSELQPYAFLWLSISQNRLSAKVPADVEARFASANLTTWPGALVQLYLGKSTPNSLLQLKGTDPDTGDDIQCTVSFFAAEWYQMQGNAAETKRLLQDASNLCDANTNSRQIALIELNRLH